MTKPPGSSIVRPLALLTAGRVVLNAAHRFIYPFLPAIARGLGISIESAGTLVSARWMAGLATPGVVHVVDRGRYPRRLIVIGLALFVVGAVGTALTGAFAGALLGFATMGLAKSTYDSASQAYLSERVPYARRARVLGVFELAWAGGFLLGAPVAGWLIDRYGWEAPFWFAAAMALVTLVVVVIVLEPETVDGVAAHEPLGLGRSAVGLLAVMGLFTGGAELVFVVLGAWLEDAFGISLLGLGGIAFVLGAMELAGEGGTVLVTDRLGKQRAVVIGLVMSALAFGLLPLFESVVVAGVAVLAIALLGFEFTIVSAIPLASEMAPQGRARYLSLTIVTMGIGRAVAAFAGPRLFVSVGLVGPALGAALANLVALVLLVAVVREHGHHDDRT
ncbi:MAG: MFS transporter [Acidimicrobiia bacterium]|nr:MFS transporter [Acidimicrobiia bacterium]